MARPRLTTSQFITKSQQRWGDKYGYQKTKYINSRTPVVLLCLKHQQYFTQTPKAHFIAKHGARLIKPFPRHSLSYISFFPWV